MKAYFASLVEKAKENKDLLIKVGAGLAGALIGGMIATMLVSNAEPEEMFPIDETNDSDGLELDEGE